MKILIFIIIILSLFLFGCSENSVIRTDFCNMKGFENFYYNYDGQFNEFFCITIIDNNVYTSNIFNEDDLTYINIFRQKNSCPCCMNSNYNMSC